MCGIAGIINIDRHPVPVGVLKKMTDVLRHRGPDSEGLWYDAFVGFGHRRLAIIDLSALAHQPMQSDDGNFVITYNGEVYNFPVIRIELENQGYTFRSKSDAEVVLKAYQAWGGKCLDKFNGMFAFAVWDKSREELFIARDRYGIKPLYYYFNGRSFIFASEIKSILQHPDYRVKVSVPALNEYFSFQNVFSDLTLFEGIKLLPPGNSLRIVPGADQTPRIDRYWDYHFEEDRAMTEPDAINELVRRFEAAVNRQLISDVEIGSYLSGGMDSGSITSVAAKTFRNLKSFTGGFDLTSASGLELGFDERQKAEFLSNLYKTEHYEVVMKAGDMEKVMPDLIWHIEDLRVGQSYPNYYVARLASKFVKVVLSGAGGDELFAGYPWRYFHSYENDTADQYLEKYYKYWQRLIPDSKKPEFYQPSIYPRIRDYQVKDVFKSIIKGHAKVGDSPEGYVNNSLYFEIRTFLHGLLLIEDKISMAHSLETRLPMLDNDLVDFAMKIPVRFKLNNITKKYRVDEDDNRKFLVQYDDGKIILRKALRHYISDTYADGIKQGFSAPDASWFKGESINYIKNILFNNQARIYEYIQPETAHKMIEEHFKGKVNRRLLIWSLLCFEWWNKIFVK